MDEVNQEIHFPISYFLYHCFYKNGNLIKYMLLLLSLRFCLIIDNGWWLTDLFLGRFSRMLIVFIGLNVLLKILRLFGNDKFLLYKMFFVMIKKL